MWQFDTAVSEIIQRTSRVKSFRFAIQAEGVTYEPGQFFFVTIKVNGKDAVHPFSFSSAPTKKGYLEFTKRITPTSFLKLWRRGRDGARLIGDKIINGS